MRHIYAIHDTKADDLVGLQMYIMFVFRTDAQAIRYFTDSVTDDKSVLAKHPEDYQLVQLGTLDDDNTLRPEKHRTVFTGSQVLAVLTSNNTIELTPRERTA